MAPITQLLSKEFLLLCQGMGASHLCPVGFDMYLVVPKLEFFPPFSRFFSTSCIRELGLLEPLVPVVKGTSHQLQHGF